MNLRQKLSALLGGTLLALGIVTPASAVTVGMEAVNATAPGLDLEVEITEVDSDTVSFAFANNSTGAAAGSSMARIYFEQGLSAFKLSNSDVDESASNGVEFTSTGPGPSNPPSIGAWGGTLIAFKAEQPPPKNGLEVGDLLVIEFDYNGDFAGLIAAITNEAGTSRIAGHVQDCTKGDSCVVAAVPLPASAALFAPALLGLWSLRRRGQRAASADRGRCIEGCES